VGASKAAQGIRLYSAAGNAGSSIRKQQDVFGEEILGAAASYTEDSPRDDLIVVGCLTSVVIGIALIPFFLRLLGLPPINLGYLETLDLIIGPVVIAGSLGVYFEDRAHRRRRGF
jgi:hypothetical protein